VVQYPSEDDNEDEVEKKDQNACHNFSDGSEGRRDVQAYGRTGVPEARALSSRPFRLSRPG
jgi:hypothetical protein